MRITLLIIWILCVLSLVANIAIGQSDLPLEEQDSYRDIIISLLGAIVACTVAALDMFRPVTQPVRKE